MNLFGTEPIRAELLSVERLEDLADLIARHRVSSGRRPEPGLLSRARENGRVLLRCYRTLAAVINEERATTPAAEWLVDNFHIVEEVLNEIRTDLPPGFYRQLPTLDERLAARGTSAHELIRAEHQRQAGANVTVRNVITSLRVMATFNWRDFFEQGSLVDRLFRSESEFGAMDFATRDRYRHAVEDLARGSGRSEINVARQALTLAGHRDRHTEDLGYYLISKGRPSLEHAVGYRVSLRQRLVRAYMTSATWSYLGSIGIVTAFLLCLPIMFTHALGVSPFILIALAALAALPASDAATALVNRAVVEMFPPRALPRLELADGVPPELKTLVVVPTLLTSRAQIAEQIAHLGVHYLANDDGALRFALLSDWTDCAQEHAPDDEALLTAARAGIAELNRRHGASGDGEPRFYLFHRRRLWSESEGRWMGWERKRGKLHELNRLLRGATDTSFMLENLEGPASIRFVITLDADTQLPRGAAARLVGTLAHPLNRPRLEPRAGRGVAGYGIRQPRIAPTLPTEREASFFRQVFSGPAGVAPYAAAVPDA